MKVNRNKTYYKIMNNQEYHHKFQYKDGLNIDIIPFNPHGSCRPGGMYFTDIKNIFMFLRHAGKEGWVREVRIPKDARVYEEGNKAKADKIIVGKKLSLSKLSTYRYLIKKGADINIENGRALVNAVYKGYTPIVKLLIKAGADVNASDGRALEEASYWNRLSIVKLLIKAGADVNINNGNALKVAVAKGHLSIVKLLEKEMKKGK